MHTLTHTHTHTHTCVCMCVNVCVCACTCTHMHAYSHTHTLTNTLIHTHLCMYTRSHAHIPTCTLKICFYSHIHFTYTHICMHTCFHTTHTHTHTHTHTQSLKYRTIFNVLCVSRCCSWPPATQCPQRWLSKSHLPRRLANDGGYIWLCRVWTACNVCGTSSVTVEGPLMTFVWIFYFSGWHEISTLFMWEASNSCGINHIDPCWMWSVHCFYETSSTMF